MAAVQVDDRFRLGKKRAEELANQFGTPLYVVDEANFRQHLRTYLESARAAWPKVEVSFASKANSTLALIKIAVQQGCAIDAASEGELRAALLAGAEPQNCHLHGNNKSRAELEFVVEMGLGYLVVDNFEEIETLSKIVGKGSQNPRIVLRLAPGVDPITHSKISTGQSDSKFGFNIMNGSAERATARCLELGMNLVGFHCHVGSQLLDPEAQRLGGESIATFALQMLERHQYSAELLNLGGGLGVRYTDEDCPMSPPEYCRLVSQSVAGVVGGTPLENITLGHEPGRYLVAESGVTLYRVGVIKTVPASPILDRTYVMVDGGLGDNPRPALYNAQYAVESFLNSKDTQEVTVSGRHCETDTLFPDIQLPKSLKPGDLLQVLCTGAYNSSMASNYNRFPRPATVLVRESGEAQMIQRAESWDEMFGREILPEDL